MIIVGLLSYRSLKFDYVGIYLIPKRSPPPPSKKKKKRKHPVHLPLLINTFALQLRSG